MGILSFFKRIFNGEEADEKELDAARARHGIIVDEHEQYRTKTDEERMAEEYSAWDELDRLRSNFLLGGWLTKKFRPIGEDKVKKQLTELERERREKEERGCKKKGED